MAMSKQIIQQSYSVHLADQQATQELGAKLAPSLRAADIVCLSGDLGAGKTTLSRGLICALCGLQDVPSPTFTLLQTYEAAAFEVWHFDLYRIKAPEDIWELGIEDAFYDGLSLIEWPERLGDLRPDGTLNITINFDGAARIALLDYPLGWPEARMVTAL